MVQGVKLTPRAAERTAAAVRRVEAMPYDNTQAPPVVRPYTPVKWLRGYNPSSLDIPPYSAVALGPVVTIDGEERTTLLQPSQTYLQAHGITGPEPIAAQGLGGYHCEVGPVASTGLVVPGAKYGPVPGSFAVAPGYPSAFECVGFVNGMMIAKVQQITRLLAKTTVASSKDSGEPIWCDICQSVTPGNGEAAIAPGVYRVPTYNKFGNVASGVFVWLAEVNNTWYIVAPAGQAATPVRFRLRNHWIRSNDFNFGEPFYGEAYVLTWDNGANDYIPVVDNDDDPIPVEVYDFHTYPTWKGRTGFEGWCQFMSDTGELEVIWMERKARVIHATLDQALTRFAPSVRVRPIRRYDGREPYNEADLANVRVIVRNIPDPSPGAQPGAYLFSAPYGFICRCDYDYNRDEYWLTWVKCSDQAVNPPLFAAGMVNSVSLTGSDGGFAGGGLPAVPVAPQEPISFASSSGFVADAGLPLVF